MAETTGTSDMTDFGARAPERPPLLRSIAHRLLGDVDELQVEGRLASFDGATGWLNAEPQTPDGLRGRVVLVDFWTYTCVNWLRTLPYRKAWFAKYRDLGFTIVGVHTPEFGFERNVDNVVARSRALGVDYPVAIDSDYAVWRAFANHYWPALYLADADGRIRYHHYGEGEYAMSEMAIQKLLLDSGAGGVSQALVTVKPRGLEVAAEWGSLGSPETYLGYRQSTGFASEREAKLDGPSSYIAAPRLPLNHWDLDGTWTVAPHAAVLEAAGGRIAFQFQARDVNLVMGPVIPGSTIAFRVYLDGVGVGGDHGTDVDGEGHGTLSDQNTYQLVRQSGAIGERRFEIEFLEGGVEAYCFTFG